MTEVVRQIAAFLNNFAATLVSLLKIAVKSRKPEHWETAGAHASLCILGNGSSLNKDLPGSGFTFTEYMVVNRFVLSPLYLSLKPKYYVLADPHFFESEEGFHLLSLIAEQTTWPLLLFIPADAFRRGAVQKKLEKNQRIRLHYFNTRVFRGFKWLRDRLYSKGLASPRVQNVVVGCLMIALRMQYKQIYLFGVEHSWIRNLRVNLNNEIYVNDDRFFENGKKQERLYVDTEYKPFLLHDLLRNFAYMFEAYFEIRELANRGGVTIINCTPDSYIQAFEKRSNTGQ